MPFGQVYTSLQTGLIDIAENGFDIVLKNKHYEAAPVVSKTEHEANCNQLWMSQKTWDSITEEQRGWVVEAAEYTRPLTIKKALELDATAAQALQKLGVKVHTQVDKQTFMTLAKPLQDPRPRSSDRTPSSSSARSGPSSNVPAAPRPRVTVRAARHLKWPLLDPLERGLMVLCALLLLGFTLVEIADVICRNLRRP